MKKLSFLYVFCIYGKISTLFFVLHVCAYTFTVKK